MRYKISHNGFPTVTISKMATGEKIYAERNSCVASSPITVDRDAPDNGLWRGRVMANQLKKEDEVVSEPPTRLSKMFTGFALNTKQTITRKQMGERSYVLYEALMDNQKATFRSCFPGTIMAWNATPLPETTNYIQDEDYYYYHPGEIVPSVFNMDEARRPHGTIRVVKGSFLVADLKVKADVYHEPDSEAKIKRLSETDNTFQEFTGDGMVFFEVHGDLQEIPLYPGEAVDVFVGYLLGFTEDVSLRMCPAGDSILRNEENSDYVIRLTAGPRGGFVYTHSVRIPEFHKKVNPEFFSRAETLAFNAQKERVNNN